QAEEAALDADYVAFGPIYATPNLSVPKPVRGLELLTRVRVVVPAPIPLVAIGGITAERVDEVRAAGADAWAVIAAVARAPDPVLAARALARCPPKRSRAGSPPGRAPSGSTAATVTRRGRSSPGTRWRP